MGPVQVKIREQLEQMPRADSWRVRGNVRDIFDKHNVEQPHQSTLDPNDMIGRRIVLIKIAMMLECGVMYDD